MGIGNMVAVDRFYARQNRYWIGVLVVALLIVGIYIFFEKLGEARSQPSLQAARAVSVVTAQVKTGNMNVYLTGLGTVTPLNKVIVKTRVDGQLMRVSFREGQIVHAGDLLAEIDPRQYEVQLKQAEGQLAKDQALLKNAQVDLERYQSLFKQDSVARQQLDTQASLVRQYDAQIKVDQGQIDNTRLQLVYCRITSPLTGRVGLGLVDPGNIVHAADTAGLLVITQVDPISVIFTIPEDSLPKLQQGMNIGRRLSTDAYDRALKRKLATGSLQTIDNQIDPTTGTVKLKSTFPNKDGVLFPNQFVNARLLVDTLHNVVLVPNAAIQHSPTSAFVYVLKPDDTVEARNVQIQGSEADQTAIGSGIVAGETVVTDGVDKLQPGTKVTVRTPQAAVS